MEKPIPEPSHRRTISEAFPDDALMRFLPGANFADAFSVESDDLPADARTLAARFLGRRPAWVSLLMTIRNAAVRPLGLRTPTMAKDVAAAVGVFPVIHASESLVLMGFDDTHLDFRVILTAGTSSGGRPRAVLTTLVKTKSAGGRLYLEAIKPLHRIIVRGLLAQ
jgi:Protein of unknown function (DUF2867)